AIKSAAAKAQLKDYEIRTYPERVDKLKTLMKRFRGGNVSLEESVAKEILKQVSSGNKELQQIRDLKAMNGRTMMLMPFEINMQ
ncbi:MAG TPA: hypothetical protein VL092_01920, partial [Chitinophagaceae bacterium]|nr:hypothetical protein [Chitinophagaceae bacterium]